MTMTRIRPLRALSSAFSDIGTAVNAAREYRNAGVAAASGKTRTGNPLTAAIPL